MKNKITLALAVVFSAALITSCSIERRHYRSGYYVNWNNKPNEKTTVAGNEQQAVLAVTENVATPVTETEVQEIAPVQNATVNADAQVAVQENNSSIVKGFANGDNVKSPAGNVDRKPVAADKQIIKQAAKKAEKPGGDVPKGLLIVLCFLLPWLAVGLATDWDVKTIVFNLLWSLTCIGGIIHALIVVNRNT